MKPSLNVVIPVYNGADHIVETVQSIFQQQTHPFHLHVTAVNDGSQDHSIDILLALSNQYPELSVIDLQQNQGVAAARNAGILHRDDEWLGFCDQDDCWVPNKLQLQWSYLQQHPQTTYTIGYQKLSLQAGHALPNWAKPEWLSGKQPGWLLANILIRKKDFLRVGILDTHYQGGTDDVDWFAKAKSLGLSHHMLDEVLVNRKIHSSNASERTATANQELLTILRKKLAHVGSA